MPLLESEFIIAGQEAGIGFGRSDLMIPLQVASHAHQQVLMTAQLAFVISCLKDEQDADIFSFKNSVIFQVYELKKKIIQLF